MIDWKSFCLVLTTVVGGGGGESFVVERFTFILYLPGAEGLDTFPSTLCVKELRYVVLHLELVYRPNS